MGVDPPTSGDLYVVDLESAMNPMLQRPKYFYLNSDLSDSVSNVKGVYVTGENQQQTASEQSVVYLSKQDKELSQEIYMMNFRVDDLSEFSKYAQDKLEMKPNGFRTHSQNLNILPDRGMFLSEYEMKVTSTKFTQVYQDEYLRIATRSEKSTLKPGKLSNSVSLYQIGEDKLFRKFKQISS